MRVRVFASRRLINGAAPRADMGVFVFAHLILTSLRIIAYPAAK
jgi:hypothetical protein